MFKISLKVFTLFVVVFSLILSACGGAPTNVVATSTSDSNWTQPTPTTSSELASKLACTFVLHGNSFTVPYTETNGYDMYEVGNIKPTEFTYTYRNVEWKMGATCHSSPGPFGPSRSIVYDTPQQPAGGTYFKCVNTDVMISGSEVLDQSCEVAYPDSGLAYVKVNNGNSSDNLEGLSLKWNWEQNVSTDTNSSPWILQYQFIGKHLGSGAPSFLECKWITWADYNSEIPWFNHEMNLNGREAGYFDFDKSNETSVICAGEGYTVTLTAN